jgi:hypothetical protein
MSIRFSAIFLFMIGMISSFAQTDEIDSLRNELRKLDSIYIAETEQKDLPAKILHAEPLFIDLIRDLGARRGEREWNVGLGLTDNKNFDSYEFLVEYEWAPIDRLGLEIELPFTFYYPIEENADVPGSRLNSLKLATQWSFLVHERWKTTLALGYLHEFEFIPFNHYGRHNFFEGNVYNPFFIVAKRWGNNFHTLIYTGPQVFHNFETGVLRTNFQVNTNFHYMIPGTRNFIGVELNKDLMPGDFDMVIRPQMRVGLTDNLLVGIVAGIPFKRENQRFSTFFRLIYEPGHGK